MSGAGATIDVVVRTRIDVASAVVLFELARPDGRPLPNWSPGAHIDVVLPDGRERQYSLCSDPADRSTWRIGVLRESGVSAHLHDAALEGTALRVRGPRNHFSFAPYPGKRYLFVAGGIGITPIRSMLVSARTAGNDFHLAYAGRTRARMAFAEELVDEFGSHVSLHVGDEGTRLDLESLLAEPDSSTVIYACGPARLLEALEDAVQAWPRGALHVERFEARTLGPPVRSEPFHVELMLSGLTLEVPPERSILEVVEDSGVVAVASCRVGTCGTCEVPVVEGEVDHRDSVLSPEEQEDSFSMMICVSRACGPSLTLEL
ncbi:PDR/VanB family oxidoreductase [Rathayibacter sp. Leaf296]|uniref:PDR/VanB family oxidoreductase n=1 Tax=Rathayibacter sp. Leaf296 TaxID=1736327 RepID=UPI00070280B9|nr:PDR/VanB family oxidoreductase [Rathayibacter sp. Leaf296]KQQ09579.1 ferredoxin [Rathayibacter sp. Leaf296]